MSNYHYTFANDNGNSKHKAMINDSLYVYPNVYSVLHSPLGEVDKSLEEAVRDLHNRMDVRIESKALSSNHRYLIGKAALDSKSDLYNMDVGSIQKHNEDIPIINSLGLLAVKAVQDHYEKKGTLQDAESLEVTVDMTTALPVSLHNAVNQKTFQDRWLNGPHQVKVYVKELALNVVIRFRVVKVLQEGVPALFTIFEDEDGNYRNDDMFDEFKEQYKEELDEEVTGEYFLDKRILHFDIGDGSTEAVYTEGYSVNVEKSDGRKFGLGATLEAAAEKLNLEPKYANTNITRQKLSDFLYVGPGKPNKKRKDAVKALAEPLNELVDGKLMPFMKKRLETLVFEVDVVVVYGGASILAKDNMYKKVLDYCSIYDIQVLWVPAHYCVEMNVRGMNMYNKIKMDELIAEAEELVNQ
ncbi:hypothetical protein BpOF4_20969 (plasmid) [Alkalihalophilus pseudofirmus OF4]|uniref:Actin-like protein N-terminal domain-containing protein n=1 Tax=Alkalihalophilus pseudofirmus (strain ATCC BAA-2126 / JCM 17055 / OF4) TaxID=398511 RepID=D3G1G3_ALKPO|nr:ParM/StbA family protein [Alkalihalophilus pseudofirmus]ADC52189.1 hypothetical protein BpOF4_20969 [Alkalihalophilus pseudofirmus OF4]